MLKRKLKLFASLLAISLATQFLPLVNNQNKVEAAGTVGTFDSKYWNSINIGSVENEGAAYFVKNERIILEGAGSIKDNKDSFKFAYIPVAGDCTIIAKITSQSNSDSEAKSGLMIRENLTDTSPNAFIAKTPDNTALFQYRTVNSGATQKQSVSGSTPMFMILQRTGNSFSAFRSSDGSNWMQIGSSINIAMPSKVYIGFASSSNKTDSLCTANFENMSVEFTDTIAPLAPYDLRVKSTGMRSYNLQWNASSDNAGVAYYNVYCNDELVGKTNDTSLDYSVPYNLKSYDTFYITAVDASGNTSERSTSVHHLYRQEIRNNDITNIRINSIGLERLNTRRIQQKKSLITQTKPVEIGSEILTDKTPNNVIVDGNPVDLNTVLAESMPQSVDNSSLPCFPPIEKQIFEDCIAFSQTYYTMTHMTGLANGWTVNSSTKDKTFSTKFTYPLAGTSDEIPGTYRNMLDSGCATLSDVPYIDDGCEGEKIHTGQEAWVNAISKRMDKCGNIRMDDSNSIYRIKQLLNNGYVLNFTTGIDSFTDKYSKLIKDNKEIINKDQISLKQEDTPIDKIENQELFNKKVCYMMDGNEGSHGMTLVGYDDNAWVDINGDGYAQDSELGIFKIANSWGTGDGDSGYRYIAYDSVLAVSNFSFLNISSRERVFDEVYWITAKKSYIPQLIGTFTINHSKINQIRISVGYSNTNQNYPVAYYQPQCFRNFGKSTSFNYTKTACDGSFAIDYTDFITKFGLSPNEKYRFYLMVEDISGDNCPVTLKDFGLLNGAVPVNYNGKMPVIRDGDSAMIYMDYAFFPQTDTIPGKVEAERYDLSGQYCIIQNCNDGGKEVNSMLESEWVDYKVKVSQSGTYKVNFRVASPSAGRLNLIKGDNTTVNVSIPSTGGFNKWKTVSAYVKLNAGEQILRLESGSDGLSINWIEFVKM